MPHPCLLMCFQRGNGIEDMKAEIPCCPCRCPMEGWGDGESCRHLSAHSLSHTTAVTPAFVSLLPSHLVSPHFVPPSGFIQRTTSFLQRGSNCRSLPGPCSRFAFCCRTLAMCGGQAPCISCHIPVAFCCGWWTQGGSGEEVWQAQCHVTASGEGQGFVSSQVCATTELQCPQA